MSPFDPRPLSDRLAAADHWYRLTREQMLEENRAQMDAGRKVGKHPALGMPYEPGPIYHRKRMTTHELLGPPPLEMECYDAGRNIPLEFGRAIQRALVFAGCMALIIAALVFAGYLAAHK